MVTKGLGWPPAGGDGNASGPVIGFAGQGYAGGQI
jgi:hypothetical protein